MYMALKNCVVRSYRLSDAESVALHGNNKKIWLNLRDMFPHPYKTEHAEIFIQRVIDSTPETNFAICVDENAVGGIGYRLHEDVERISAELGYWLGESYWGQGIMTEAVKGITLYAMDKHELKRIFAVPYETNTASHRVLEKVGYVLEGRMRKSVIKDGKVLDQLLYAYVA